MPTTTIQLPPDFVSNILSYGNTVIASLSTYTALIISVLFGMIIIGFLVGLLRS